MIPLIAYIIRTRTPRVFGYSLFLSNRYQSCDWFTIKPEYGGGMYRKKFWRLYVRDREINNEGFGS